MFPDIDLSLLSAMKKQQQSVPVNLYFHTNKQEWRARYMDNGLKKAKHFSCKRYRPKRAFFLGSIFMRKLHDTNELPSEAFLSFWTAVSENIKVLDDGVAEVIKVSTASKDSNSSEKCVTSDVLLAKSQIGYESRQLLKKVLEDISSQLFVSKPSKLNTPKIDLERFRNEYLNVSQSGNGEEVIDGDATSADVTSSNLFSAEEHPENSKKNEVVLNLRTILRKILSDGSEYAKDNGTPSKNQNLSNFEQEGATTIDTLRFLRRINDNTISETVGLLNNYEGSEVHDAHSCKNVVDNFIKSVEDNISNVREMCKDVGMEFTSDRFHKPSLKYPIDSFTPESIAEFSNKKPHSHKNVNLVPGPTLMDSTRNNSLYDIGNSSYLPRANTMPTRLINKVHDNFAQMQGQVTRSRYENLEGKEELEPRGKMMQRKEKIIQHASDFRNMCNDKLHSFIEQSEIITDPEAFSEAVYMCLDEESKVTSDLESLIQITSRNLKEKTKDALFSGYTLYDIIGTSNAEHIDVKYINGKIIPSSALPAQTPIRQSKSKLFSKVEHANAEPIPIVLSGKEKLDIHFEEVFGRICEVHKYQISQTLRAVEIIEEKTNDIVTQYERMHRALFRYSKTRQNRCADDQDNTNDLEELLNLEMLHIVCETLMGTKSRLLEQVQRDISNQIDLLHSVMPPRFYKILTEILYGKRNAL